MFLRRHRRPAAMVEALARVGGPWEPGVVGPPGVQGQPGVQRRSDAQPQGFVGVQGPSGRMGLQNGWCAACRTQVYPPDYRPPPGPDLYPHRCLEGAAENEFPRLDPNGVRLEGGPLAGRTVTVGKGAVRIRVPEVRECCTAWQHSKTRDHVYAIDGRFIETTSWCYWRFTPDGPTRIGQHLWAAPNSRPTNV